MRTIKFRGKNGKKWVFGNLECFPEVETYLINGRDVNVDTIGQYTGFNDAKGQPIYEGDILKTAFSDKPWGIVRWNAGGGYFFIDEQLTFNFWNFNSCVPIGEILAATFGGRPVVVEVIGNIYDNKELIKEEK